MAAARAAPVASALELVEQRRAAETEDFGRARLVSAGLSQRLLDQRGLEPRDGGVEVDRAVPELLRRRGDRGGLCAAVAQPRRQVLDLHRPLANEHHEALEEVLHL